MMSAGSDNQIKRKYDKKRRYANMCSFEFEIYSEEEKRRQRKIYKEGVDIWFAILLCTTKKKVNNFSISHAKTKTIRMQGPTRPDTRCDKKLVLALLERKIESATDERESEQAREARTK